MSALTGLPNASGVIVTSGGAPTIFRRGMGFDAATGALCVATSAPGGLFNGTVMVDPATGAMMHSTVNAIASYTSGVPLDANGALCTEVAAAVSFVQGVGLTAAGRVAIQ